MGDNSEGALGTGSAKARDYPAAVSGALDGYAAEMCAVGDGFMIVAAQPLAVAEDAAEPQAEKKDGNVPQQDIMAWGAGFMGFRYADLETQQAENLAMPSKVCLVVPEEEQEEEQEEHKTADEKPTPECGPQGSEQRPDGRWLLPLLSTGKPLPLQSTWRPATRWAQHRTRPSRSYSTSVGQ
jgi:hypothetical protein